ncbi:MAG: 50S ribosomal protein L1 [Patescibacteria group bacterium]
MYSKRYQKIKKQVDSTKSYNLGEAIDLIKSLKSAKFDETIDIHIKLGINPSKTEQQAKGSVILPNGAVKTKKIVAFVSEKHVQEAKDAGADLVGGEELIKEIKETGKCNFDVAVAHPDMMRSLAQVAKILGPKGLMPTPKLGTITEDISKIIGELKKGKVAFKNDAGGNVHQAMGKVSWDKEKIQGNMEAFLAAVRKSKPAGVKSNFIKSVSIASTMGPGLKISI